MKVWPTPATIGVSGIKAFLVSQRPTFGIIANHPFFDGNKRTTLVASFAFLDVNGVEVTASQEEASLAILGTAAGEISEQELALWFSEHTAALK
jgi:death-on-curing family protein